MFAKLNGRTGLLGHSARFAAKMSNKIDSERVPENIVRFNRNQKKFHVKYQHALIRIFVVYLSNIEILLVAIAMRGISKSNIALGDANPQLV